jgi:hypothetical protein
MVVRTNMMRNFPVVACNASEGALTRYTTGVTADGGVEPVAVYATPIAKGDLVVLDGSNATNGTIVVSKAAAGDNIVHGIAVSDPQGIDNTTASAGTPAAALQRRVDIAFFGIGIIELQVSSTGAVEPGDVLGLDSDESMQVETQIAHDGAISAATNGGFVALSYGTHEQYIPILVGASLWIGN